MTEHQTNGFRTVLVGYDGSPQADDALALAGLLVDRDGGRLVLVNVYPFYRGWSFSATPGMYATLLHDAAVATLEAGAEMLDPAIPRTLIPLSDSSVARGIDEVALSEHADLIVLGSTHRGTFGRLTGRTTVQRLLHGAPCAVAIAAPAQRLDRPHLREIGVAYDGSPEARDALAVAYALAAREHAQVRIARAAELVEFGSSYVVTAEDERFRERLELRAERDVEEAVAAAPPGVVAEGRIAIGRAGPAVLSACADVDLLVCGSRSYGPARRALAGSTALSLVAHAAIPVLIVPRPSAHQAPEVPDPVGTATASEES